MEGNEKPIAEPAQTEPKIEPPVEKPKPAAKPLMEIPPKKPEIQDDLGRTFTLKEAAPLLFMSVSTLKRHIHEGTIKRIKHPQTQKVYIEESEVKRIRRLIKGGKKVEPEPIEVRMDVVDKTAPKQEQPAEKEKEETKEEGKGWSYHPFRHITYKEKE